MAVNIMTLAGWRKCRYKNYGVEPKIHNKTQITKLDLPRGIVLFSINHRIFRLYVLLRNYPVSVSIQECLLPWSCWISIVYSNWIDSIDFDWFWKVNLIHWALSSASNAYCGYNFNQHSNNPCDEVKKGCRAWRVYTWAVYHQVVGIAMLSRRKQID